MKTIMSFVIVLVVALAVYAVTPTQETPSITGHNYLTTNIISEWRLENTAIDNWEINNGTIYGANKTDGYVGIAYLFDGIDDYIDIPYNSVYNFGVADSFSYGGWFKSPGKGIGTTMHLIGRYGSGAVPRYGIKTSGDQLNVFQIDNNSNSQDFDCDPNFYLNDSQWHHVFVSVNRNINYSFLYVDGQECGNTSITSLTGTFSSPSGNFQMGKISSYNYNGYIDEALLFNKSLNATEISTVYKSYNGTVRLTQPQDFSATLVNVVDSDTSRDNITEIYDWRMNGTSLAKLYLPFEANGQESIDTTSYGTTIFTGNVTGATWNSTGGYNGFGAYTFNGTTDYINLGDVLQMGTSDLTACAWIFNTKDWSALSWGPGIVGKTNYGGEAYRWSLFIYKNKLGALIHANVLYTLDTNGTVLLNDNKWHHTCVVFDRDENMTTYIDGIKDATVNISVTASYNMTGTRNASIGLYAETPTPTGFFQGTIDDVRVYYRALSKEQINLLFLKDIQTIKYQEANSLETWSVCTTINDGTADSATKCGYAVTDNPPSDPGPVPEFSTITMILAILIAITGIIITRKK